MTYVEITDIRGGVHRSDSADLTEEELNNLDNMLANMNSLTGLNITQNGSKRYFPTTSVLHARIID
jgi:hypothetical protein